METVPRSPEPKSLLSHSASPLTYSFGPFWFMPESLELWRGDHRVSLPPKPAKLLQLLLSREGRAVPRSEMISVLWSDRIVSYDKSLNFTVLELRRALEDDARHPRYVETMPRIGYRFVAPVQVESGHDRPLRSRPCVHDSRTEKRGFSRPRAALSAIVLLIMAGSAATVSKQWTAPGDGPEVAARTFHLRGLDLLHAAATAEARTSSSELAREGLRQLALAAELEPGNAEFWLALADARLRQALAQPDLLPLAAAATEHALALDPASPRALLRMGDVKSLYDRDWRGAEQAYRKALELDPLLVETHRHLATHYLLMRDFDRAIAHTEKALELAPMSSVLQGEAGWTYLYAGRHKEALRLCDRALDLAPSFLHARQCALYASAYLGREERTETEARQILISLGGDQQTTLPTPPVEARALDVFHRRYVNLPAKDGWQRIDRALALAALGQSTQALRELEHAERDRLPQLLFRIRDPRLKELEEEPRFRSLMARLALAV